MDPGSFGTVEAVFPKKIGDQMRQQDDLLNEAPSTVNWFVRRRKIESTTAANGQEDRAMAPLDQGQTRFSRPSKMEEVDLPRRRCWRRRSRELSAGELEKIKSVIVLKVPVVTRPRSHVLDRVTRCWR